MRFFRWLASLFRRSDPFNMFTVKERLIYHYWDGQRMVSVDPMELFKKLIDVAPKVYVDAKVVKFGMKDAPAKQKELIESVRGMFGIKPYDQGGLTETESMELFYHFLEFTERIKKNSSQSPMPQEGDSTGSSIFSGDGPPTKNPSGSGSTASEPSTETSPSSPTGQPSLSGQ